MRSFRVFPSRVGNAVALAIAAPALLIASAASAQTVEQAVSSGCSTTSVAGLSLQIIGQAQCIEPNAFTEVPTLANVTFGPAVFPYLEAPARDALVAAAQASPNKSMTVNSMLRTVAQQYLLYRWYQTGQCGIGLAATPGNSNHETGLALDISEYSSWKSSLESVGFNWYGNSDAVHFTYAGAGAVDYRGLDVQAFQELWNLNHPGEPIGVDGDWGSETLGAMQESPAQGFPLGPSCQSTSGPGPDLRIFTSFDALDDVFDDGASAGLADTWVDDRFEVSVVVTNQGDVAVSALELGVTLPTSWLVATDYRIESDWTHPGEFAPSDADQLATNPPHADELGELETFEMAALSPGETKRIVFAAEAIASSVGAPPVPTVAAWVRSADDVYSLEGPDATPVNPGNTQTFNGGVLMGTAGVDVYDPLRWLWDTDRREGWNGEGGTMATVAGGALVIDVGDATSEGRVASPALAVDAATYSTLYLAVEWRSARDALTVYFATEDAPEFDEARAVAITRSSDEPGELVEVRLAEHPDYRGTVTRLWLSPAAGTPLSVHAAGFRSLDDVDVGPVGPGTHGNPVRDDAESDEGCACRAAAPARTTSRGWLLALALVAWERRRRRAPSERRR